MMNSGSYTGRRIKRKDANGQYIIGERLGGGGEGEVYAVTNSPDWAVKIYKPDKAPQGVQAKKLITMEGLMPPLANEQPGHPSLAWPQQIIRNQGGARLIGLVMPRVNTNKTMTIGEFFTPSIRQEKLRDMKCRLTHRQIMRRQWRIINNLAGTIARVHEQGHLIGDINDRNILVEPVTSAVSIIDCDSFQIRDAKNHVIYRRQVGRPDYTAPELLLQMQENCVNAACPNGPGKHQVGYPCVTRDETHDRFSMAVIVFQIVMEGNHPYDCRIEAGHASEVHTRQEKIKRGYYPYSRAKPSYIHVNNRDNEVRYSKLPAGIKHLFERAFTGNPSSRPS